MRRYVITIALTLVAIGILYYRGRSLWHPIKVRILGARTVEQVTSLAAHRMIKKFPDLAALADGRELAILAFKEERHLELWKQYEHGWHMVRRYLFTGFSGMLGPKLYEGDLQIPEGLYRIELLNPNSSYHLSMKINYPNAYDREKAEKEQRTNLGGDIFIHGKSVTTGCIPIGDTAIEELFCLVSQNGLHHTRVIIAPYDMRKGYRHTVRRSVPWQDELYAQIEIALLEFPVASKSGKQKRRASSAITTN